MFGQKQTKDRQTDETNSNNISKTPKSIQFDPTPAPTVYFKLLDGKLSASYRDSDKHVRLVNFRALTLTLTCPGTLPVPTTTRRDRWRGRVHGGVPTAGRQREAEWTGQEPTSGNQALGGLFTWTAHWTNL